MLLFSLAWAGFTDVSPSSGVGNGSVKDGGIVLSDLDHDGWLDLVLATYDGTSVQLHTGAGMNYGIAVVVPFAPDKVYHRQLLLVDFDHDGITDMVRTSHNGIDVQRGLSANSFASVSQIAANAEGAAAVDVNDDGWLDVLVEDNGNTLVMQNNLGALLVLPVGSFGFSSVYDSRDYLAAGDLDGDRDIDLIVRTEAAPLWRDNGGTYANEAAPMNATNRTKGGVSLCDFDNDGDLDYVFAGGAYDSDDGIVAFIAENEGVGWSTIPVVYPVPLNDTYYDYVLEDSVYSHGSGTTCGDVDLDGDLDVVISWTGDGALLQLTNDLDFEFSVTEIDDAWDGKGLTLGDVDRDGDLDIALSMRDEARLYRNDLVGGESVFVEPLARVGGTCSSPIYRTDWYARASMQGALSGVGVRELGSADGRGGQATPWLHFAADASGPDELVLELRTGKTGRVARLMVPSFAGYPLWTVHDDDLDGDGVLNQHEGPGDTDEDGFADDEDGDADNDGFPDVVEAGAYTECAPTLADTDADGTPDVRDLDSDGDGVLDASELDGDTDGDRQDDRVDDDDDGDGIPTEVEGMEDLDGDLLPNYLDLDADGDGVDDVDELADVDGDGIPGWSDADDNDGPLGDLDGDGLDNETEEALGTDPNLSDTDDGGVDDGVEVAEGKDPLDPTDDFPVEPEDTAVGDTGIDTLNTDGTTTDYVPPGTDDKDGLSGKLACGCASTTTNGAGWLQSTMAGLGWRRRR